MMDDFKKIFREEASELLCELESALLELEDDPENPDLIGRVFRAMHTIKGSGGMAGFDDIMKFTHEVESVFDKVRNGEVKVTKGMIDLTLDARDQIRMMIDADARGERYDQQQAALIIAGLKDVAAGRKPVRRTAAAETSAVTAQPSPPSGQAATKVRSAADFSTYLTELETSRIRASLRVDRTIYAVDRLFSIANFREEIKHFSAKIADVGELISTVPNAKQMTETMTGFTILFASSEPADRLVGIFGADLGTVDGWDFSAHEAAHEGRNVTYRIRFTPLPDVMAHGTNPLPLLNELRQLGACEVIAKTGRIPRLEEIDPEKCYIAWDIVLTTDRGMNTVRDVFIFIEDDSDLRIDVIDDGSSGMPVDYKKVGEILVERGDIGADELKSVLDSQKKIGELLVDSGMAEPTTVESALTEQRHVKEMRERRAQNETVSSVRVSSERLDSLMNLVGELVTVQARLTQIASTRTDPELLTVSEEVERLTESLRDRTMSIRMLPISTTFSKFKRLVRDLAKDLGKEAELKTDGGDTELDKTVIERLNDPLVHLIRNSIDHGIEPPGQRRKSGKPECGTVFLSAVHSGAHVLIRIQDDGAGIDSGAVRQKAVEKGLIPADADLTEKEIFSLILTPGFSTSETVTNVSGRGVGMDVVKKGIDLLRGTIDISSHPGFGTTITLKLPLTLAIIEGLLVRIGAEVFILPLSMVEECIELTDKKLHEGHGRRIVSVRDQIVPYISLRDQFGVNGGKPAIEQIVIVNAEGRRVGFSVDSVIGEHQTVIKSLGKFYRDVRGISGATILGDGTVALILDVPKLIHTVEEEENS
ncbi:MAG: hypothetical protein OHK006_17650 [Thermodesulfovibrionales bacterium]